MKLTVHVFPVSLDAVDDYLPVRMPRGAVLLTAYRQLRKAAAGAAPSDPVGRVEHLVVAALCDPAAPLVTRRLRVAGTGHPLGNDTGLGAQGPPASAADAGGRYVGTALFMDDTYVLHVFDLGETGG